MPHMARADECPTGTVPVSDPDYIMVEGACPAGYIEHNDPDLYPNACDSSKGECAMTCPSPCTLG